MFVKVFMLDPRHAFQHAESRPRYWFMLIPKAAVAGICESECHAAAENMINDICAAADIISLADMLLPDDDQSRYRWLAVARTHAKLIRLRRKSLACQLPSLLFPNAEMRSSLPSLLQSCEVFNCRVLENAGMSMFACQYLNCISLTRDPLKGSIESSYKSYTAS